MGGGRLGGRRGARAVPPRAISAFWTRADDGSRLREGKKITVTSASLEAAAAAASAQCEARRPRKASEAKAANI